MLLLASLASSLTATASAVTNIPGATAQPASYFYTGKPYDADLNAYVFNNRNYSSAQNRWTTFDPIGFPDGANNFSYVGNTPLTAVDLLGWETQWIYGTFTWKKTWIEERHFTLGGNPSISISFPWSVGVEVTPGTDWRKTGSIGGQKSAGTQPSEEQAPDGWHWLADTITIILTIEDSGASYSAFGPDQRSGEFNVKYEWKRQAEKDTE
jgi:RHS repeat-associated protein